MPVRPDPAYADAVSPRYGEFLGLYESAHKQASARLFRKRNFLRAYLSYEKGLEPEQMNDEYLADLERIAREQNLELQILHVA